MKKNNKGSIIINYFLGLNYSDYVLVAGIAIIFIWIETLILSLSKYPRAIAPLGQLGDSFGFVNALFSGLAFVAVIYNLYQQQKQAHDDRQLSARQAFESTFFELNRISRESKASIRLAYDPHHVYLGTAAANEIRTRFARGLDKEYPEGWENISRESIVKEFKKFLEYYAVFIEFIAFFGVIAAKLEMMESRPITGYLNDDRKEKERLLEIVRASLDSDTLALMLLYGLYNPHVEFMINKYNLAKYMNPGEIYKLCCPYYGLPNVDQEKLV